MTRPFAYNDLDIERDSGRAFRRRESDILRGEVGRMNIYRNTGESPRATFDDADVAGPQRQWPEEATQEQAWLSEEPDYGFSGGTLELGDDPFTAGQDWAERAKLAPLVEEFFAKAEGYAEVMRRRTKSDPFVVLGMMMVLADAADEMFTEIIARLDELDVSAERLEHLVDIHDELLTD